MPRKLPAFLTKAPAAEKPKERGGTKKTPAVKTPGPTPSAADAPILPTLSGGWEIPVGWPRLSEGLRLDESEIADSAKGQSYHRGRTMVVAGKVRAVACDSEEGHYTAQVVSSQGGPDYAVKFFREEMLWMASCECPDFAKCNDEPMNDRWCKHIVAVACVLSGISAPMGASNASKKMSVTKAAEGGADGGVENGAQGGAQPARKGAAKPARRSTTDAPKLSSDTVLRWARQVVATTEPETEDVEAVHLPRGGGDCCKEQKQGQRTEHGKRRKPDVDSEQQDGRMMTEDEYQRLLQPKVQPASTPTTMPAAEAKPQMPVISSGWKKPRTQKQLSGHDQVGRRDKPKVSAQAQVESDIDDGVLALLDVSSEPISSAAKSAWPVNALAKKSISMKSPPSKEHSAFDDLLDF